MSIDPYAALGLTKTASAEEIKKAYRRIARTSHPDLNPDDASAEAKFKAASAAYDLLKDPETRARYDAGEIDGSGAEKPERRYYRDYAEAPGNPYRQGPRFEDLGDEGDIFAELFRRQAQGSARGQGGEGFKARGPDLRYALEVPFLDAANGETTRITLPEGGTMDVAIPKGASDGQTIRLRGKGGAGYGGGPPGDALVTLSVREHAIFRREGNDIRVVLPITLYEAVLGGKVETPTIAGPVKLTVPKGATGGQVLRLRGRGVASAGQAPGDQLVELRIVTPPAIDADLEDFMQSWRESHGYDPRRGMKP